MKSKIIELYQQGISAAKVADQLGISKSAAARVIRAAGVVRPVKFTQEQIERWKKDAEKGLSIPRIAKKHGASESAVRSHLKGKKYRVNKPRIEEDFVFGGEHTARIAKLWRPTKQVSA